MLFKSDVTAYLTCQFFNCMQKAVTSVHPSWDVRLKKPRPMLLGCLVGMERCPRGGKRCRRRREHKHQTHPAKPNLMSWDCTAARHPNIVQVQHLKGKKMTAFQMVQYSNENMVVLLYLSGKTEMRANKTKTFCDIKGIHLTP